MKVLFQDYTFDPSLKQVKFNTTDSVFLENILLITNVTDNQIIYNFANPNQGGTISNNLLTLSYNTTSMSSSDRLQIFLDLKGAPATEDTLHDLRQQTALLKRISKLVDSLSVVDAAQRQRVSIDSAPATITVTGGLGTITAVSTVSNIALNAGMGSEQYLNIARNAYANGIRSKLSF